MLAPRFSVGKAIKNSHSAPSGRRKRRLSLRLLRSCDCPAAYPSGQFLRPHLQVITRLRPTIQIYAPIQPLRELRQWPKPYSTQTSRPSPFPANSQDAICLDLGVHPNELSSPAHSLPAGIQLYSKGLPEPTTLRTISAHPLYSTCEWSPPAGRMSLLPHGMRLMRPAGLFWLLTPLLPHFCGELQRSQRPGAPATSHLVETIRISTQNMGGGTPSDHHSGRHPSPTPLPPRGIPAPPTP